MPFYRLLSKFSKGFEIALQVDMDKPAVDSEHVLFKAGEVVETEHDLSHWEGVYIERVEVKKGKGKKHGKSANQQTSADSAKAAGSDKGKEKGDTAVKDKEGGKEKPKTTRTRKTRTSKKRKSKAAKGGSKKKSE